ncbi:hypothetical protein [Burkholderia gladioli]|uniref:hypothetical protein n=1 Tax=Burkholderia gladioli TaxID=28095 RepID=UPI0006186E87|nr:hypothetical protein [Burkholderia gladioli]MBW5286523.1 antitoxin of toxin-antitoxin stability system [Burkholderia gladioli]
MHTHTLSFRAGDTLAADTRIAAELTGQKLSDYIRTAVQEKNDRAMAERITRLSHQLAAAHRAEHQELDGSVNDGLA